MRSVDVRTLPPHTIVAIVKGLVRTNPDGGTYPPLPPQGYVVAVSKEFETCEELIHEEFRYNQLSVGYIGWYLHKNGRLVYERSSVFGSKEFAISSGKSRNQYSIWDIEEGKEIVL